MSITVFFADVPDPRGRSNAQRYSLPDILVIALCAMLSGATSFVDMSRFAEAKLDWLRERLDLDLPDGVPSHDVFNDIFRALDQQLFAQCLQDWTRAVRRITKGQFIAIDGKTLRRSFNSSTGNAALHLVSAWCSRNGLVLAQVPVDSKSNESKAVPQLLRMLDLHGCLITVDAMNTQKEIAGQIVGQGGEYLMALKENHPILHEDVEAHFHWTQVRRHKGVAAQELYSSKHEETTYGHGRREVRRCWSVEASSVFEDVATRWPGLRSISLIERRRRCRQTGPDAPPQWGPETVERQYYIGNCAPDAERIARAGREHWGIENGLHWVLDMAFNEDQCRVRKDNAAVNLATLRHITLNMLKLDTTKKVGLKIKMHCAGWDENYLLRLLAGPEV